MMLKRQKMMKKMNLNLKKLTKVKVIKIMIKLK